ncbi:MAG: SpoIIE family protein phosphatase [Burkholderiales bacterium]|nr:SpoIIE family protein phosphatase [Burkholderiales bacterium]
MLTQTQSFVPLAAIKPGSIPTARDILLQYPVVSPAETNNEILHIFAETPHLIGLPVIEEGYAIGLINRNIFMDSIARPFHREIFGKKSCIAFMDKTPLVVEQSTSIQDLSFLVVDAGKKALTDGLIIVENGRYVGMGMGHDLVRVISNMQAQKNHIVMESIGYASVIQKSYLRSSRDDMASTLKDYFIHWEPRDVVGGDYYYFSKFDDGFFVAIIDCTGHGVPGAFMTLIMASTLDHVLTHEKRHNPAEVLSMMNRLVKVSLGQVSEKVESIIGEPVTADDEATSDDGMDAAFCWFDMKTNVLTYAGAKMPIFISQRGEDELITLDGDRKGVGYAGTPMDFVWENKEITLKKDDCIYITTDGIIDQIGGEKNIAYGKKRLRQLLQSCRHLPMIEQRNIVMDAFYTYQGEHFRRDDVTILGFRI